MAEMWGFGEERSREERRRKFWGAPERDTRADMEDDQPWLQFRRNGEENEAGFEEAGEEWADGDVAPEEPGYLEDNTHAPANGGGHGWQNFLVDRMRSAPGEDTAGMRAAGSFVAPRREPAPPPVMPLTVEMTIDVQIAVGLCTALSQDWRSLEPTVADIVIRSLARAIRREPSLAEHPDAIAVMDLGSDTGIGYLVEGPATKTFKALVAELAEATTEEVEPAVAAFTDYGMLGIQRATPRIGQGQLLSLALGARQFDPLKDADGVDATFTLAYDGNRVSDGAAARVLARVRHYLETPEDLLAA